MPVDLTIDERTGIVYSTFRGKIETAELVNHIAALKAHPCFRPDYNELVDVSGVTAFDVPTEDLRELAMENSPFDASSIRVLVAPADLLFGLARMFQGFGGETRPNLIVVRSLAEAYRTLGLQPLPKAQ
jgi:hypothetical protein